MFVRRGTFGTLFLVGLGVLLGSLLSSEAAGGLLAAPFVALALLFKVAFFAVLLSLVARAFAVRTGRRGWQSAAPGRWADEAIRRHDHREDATDHFDEWHRMAHARQEVDESVPPVED